MRLFILAFITFLPFGALAQERDSVFRDYESYSKFVDDTLMSRDFISLIQNLGGRDEYTKEQIAAVNVQLLGAFPRDFENVTVFKRTDLGGGLWQEARAYWTNDGYAFFYAFLHQRQDDLIVLQFNLNSSSEKILEKF